MIFLNQCTDIVFDSITIFVNTEGNIDWNKNFLLCAIQGADDGVHPALGQGPHGVHGRRRGRSRLQVYRCSLKGVSHENQGVPGVAERSRSVEGGTAAGNLRV